MFTLILYFLFFFFIFCLVYLGYEHYIWNNGVSRKSGLQFQCISNTGYFYTFSDLNEPSPHVVNVFFLPLNF